MSFDIKVGIHIYLITLSKAEARDIGWLSWKHSVFNGKKFGQSFKNHSKVDMLDLEVPMNIHSWDIYL